MLFNEEKKKQIENHMHRHKYAHTYSAQPTHTGSNYRKHVSESETKEMRILLAFSISYNCNLTSPSSSVFACERFDCIRILCASRLRSQSVREHISRRILLYFIVPILAGCRFSISFLISFRFSSHFVLLVACDHDKLTGK